MDAGARHDEKENIMSEKMYDEEFQRNAVDLWIKNGKSANQVAADPGVSGNSLSNR